MLYITAYPELKFDSLEWVFDSLVGCLGVGVLMSLIYFASKIRWMGGQRDG